MPNVGMWCFINTVLRNEKQWFALSCFVFWGLENKSEQNGLLALGLRL
jgi:hypothetical protein